ncbi:hypothetical protein HED51_11335 [Ochrobactrum grignonense]|nr:hypothetical protein [Brucella grignonensis]
MTVAVYTFENWQCGIKPPKGWDCADAVADFWTRENLDAFMRSTVRPWYPPTDKPLPDPDEYGATPEYLDHAPPLADYADQAVPLACRFCAPGAERRAAYPRPARPVAVRKSADVR